MTRQVEHGLQVGVARHLELCLDPERTWWSAIDHAAKLGPRYGAERKRRGVKRGLPDLIIMWEFEEFIGIELKTSTGKQTPAQIEVSETWLRVGYRIFVARSLKDVQAILERCRIPMRRKMTVF